MLTRTQEMADVCLILEGTYPYVTGGVSSWTHDLITSQSQMKFHLVSILPAPPEGELCYKLPDNVCSITHLYLRKMPRGAKYHRHLDRLLTEMEPSILQLHNRGGMEDLSNILKLLGSERAHLGRELLLNSRSAWEMLLRMYRSTVPQMPFLDYFWTWRALMSGFYSMLFAELPRARVYHTMSTGYAGLLAARARIEMHRPVLLTEHGIYTNERRIDIALSGWPYETPDEGYHIRIDRRDLKRMWIDSFTGYSKACYQSCAQILTLYGGNQQLQIEDGADPSRMRIIPNGIHFEKYCGLRSRAYRPRSIALIGRVVPIKDIKTFLRACALLKESVPDLKAWVLGPTEEDPAYYQECRQLTEELELSATVTFTGGVNLEEYLGRIDILVLTSLSEAQPLVILEAGAAGIPAVATHVGACSELIEGRPGEDPPLGPAGEITPLANPLAIAKAIGRLLTDRDWYQQCSRTIQERVKFYYNKRALDAAYQEIYETYRKAADEVLEPVRVH